jgi:hypothetical protein
MDAALSAREPLARRSTPPGSAPAPARAVRAKGAVTERDTSSSPAEPLTEGTADSSSKTSADTAPTKRLPAAGELADGAVPDSPDAVLDRAGSVTRPAAPAAPAAATSDTTGETTVDTTKADEPDEAEAATVPIAAAEESPAAETPAAETPAGAGTAITEGAAADPATGAVAGGTAAESPGPHQVPYGRTVTDLADRLDDSRFFSSLFDLTFTNYVTRKLAGPVYVVGLVLIALGVIVGFANALTSAIATHAPIGAFVFLFGVLITLVGAMLAVLLLRVGIEVFCAIIEIAQNTRRRRPPGE